MSEPRDRTPRRQRGVRHIVECGERIVFEFGWLVAHGMSFDDALEFLGAFDPADCRAADIADFPIGQLKIVNGGRR
jgi:hypothetical protein